MILANLNTCYCSHLFCKLVSSQGLPQSGWHNAHKYFTITPNVNYKCRGSVAAIALPVAAIALPQPPIYLKLT